MNSDASLPVANPSVIFRELPEGGVIFSTVDEVYFGLNEVGARVWTLLPPVSRTFGEVVAALRAAYPDVDAEVINTDVAELLAELERHGLLIGAGVPAAASAAREPQPR